MIVWRRGVNMLFAGNTRVVSDARYGLHAHAGGNRMELRAVGPADAGDFVCQVSVAADAIIEVTHTMEVLGEGRLKVQGG